MTDYDRRSAAGPGSLWAAMLTTAMWAGSSAAWAGDAGGGGPAPSPRPAAPQAPAAPAEKPHYYNRVVAVCVGVENYASAKVPPAPDAESDAQLMATLFRDVYGYEVVPLVGPAATRAAVLAALDKYQRELGERDALVVYFSGHGRVIDLPSFGRAGYLVPYDAALDLTKDTDPEDWARAGLDMSRLTENATAAPAQHVLFIVNACCSGFMAHRGNVLTIADNPARQELMVRRSRAVIAATTDNQSASSGGGAKFGHFTTALEAALRTRAAVSAGEVFVPLREAVTAKSNRTMLPQMGVFGTDGGEFVFLPKAIPASEIAQAVRDIEATRRQRMAQWTKPAHVFDLVDLPDYRFSPKRNDLEREWTQRLARFRANAALGDPLALVAASLCYSRGIGTARDAEEAYRLARLAFDTGRPEGKYAVGVCLAGGIGVEANALVARELLG